MSDEFMESEIACSDLAVRSDALRVGLVTLEPVRMDDDGPVRLRVWPFRGGIMGGMSLK